MIKVSTTIETITPKMAESWLEKNNDNRAIRDHHVTLLAKEMKEGRWHLNGEAIKFDHNGQLLDGQHRLWASLTYGHTFESVVVRGVDPVAFQTLDSGMKRSAGDVLAKAGMSYGTLTAAALRLVHFYETGRRDHLAVARMSNSETLAMAKKYPGISHAVALVGPKIGLKRLCSMTAMAAFTYFALEVGEDETGAFLGALVSGADLKRGDPRLTCRNFFINPRQSDRRLHHRVQFALLIKTWNATCEKRDLSVLKFLDGEEFPVFSHHTKGRRPVTLRRAA